uniref:Uncharacterized protein LOC111134282 n=1 Tax=Crassostrea virginica TaxID=6565 RepID=A0A8B8EE03_CRAVI|nr:uncharacterized protein LOC111134282 [Crassostrea virginica]
MEMLAFMKRGTKQMPTLDSNLSRIVTKVRWIVEESNGRLKHWQYLAKTLPNSQFPFIGDYVRIVAALCNKYRPPLAAKMLHLSQRVNTLQERVENEGLDRRGLIWKTVDAADVAPDFPLHTENDLRQLTLGIYQLRMAQFYSQEHFDIDGGFNILVNDGIPGLVSAKIQSRHVLAKQYKCWIGYNDGVVNGWYRKCKAGTGVVGICGHISCIV